MTRKGHGKGAAQGGVVVEERCGGAVDRLGPCSSLDLGAHGGEGGRCGKFGEECRSSSFMLEQVRQQQQQQQSEEEEREQGVRAALSGSDSCTHSCSQSDVQHHQRKSFKVGGGGGGGGVESRSGEPQGGSQSSLATAGALAGSGSTRVWVQSRTGLGSKQGVGTMTALATQSSFSTGLDQGQGESSSTNLQAQGQGQGQGQGAHAGPARKSCNRPFLQELDQQAAAHAQSAGAKRRRKSADQELADINSANSISATSPANSCDKNTGELQSSAKMMMHPGPGDEIDKHSGTEGQQQPDELAMASEPAGAGPGGTTSRYTPPAPSFSELKCRETMFVSSSNSSNPVTECTNNADAEACKSPSPAQQQPGSKDCPGGQNQRRSKEAMQQARDGCADPDAHQPAWRRSAPTLPAATEEQQGAAMDVGGGHFPIFDTGAANKRFKADVMSSPSRVVNGMLAPPAGTVASSSGSRQLLAHQSAAPHLPSSDKQDDQRSSGSWLQLGMASSPAIGSRQAHVQVGRPQQLTVLGWDDAAGPGRDEPDRIIRPSPIITTPAELEQDRAVWRNAAPSDCSGPQPIRPGAYPPGVATLGHMSTESILTSDLAMLERPSTGMLHHRPTARNGSFTVAENSAFSAPDTRLGCGATRRQGELGTTSATGVEPQSRYRMFLEETGAAGSKERDGAPNFGPGAAADSAASLGLSMFPPSRREEGEEEAMASSRDGHLLVWNHVAGTGTQGRQDSQLPLKLDLMSNPPTGAHKQLPNHVMFDHGRTNFHHAAEQIINVPRATAPVQPRNSWLANGVKHDGGPSGLGRSEARNLPGMASTGTDHRAMDSSMQSAQAPAAAQNHVWHMVTMQQGGQYPSSPNSSAYTSSPGIMGRADPKQSRNWEDVARHGRLQASAPDQALFPQSHPAGKPKPDDTWHHMVMKRAHTMNVGQFQQPAGSQMQDISSARGHSSSRPLPPPTTAGFTTMQFLNNFPPAHLPAMMNLPAATSAASSIPAHYLAPNHMSFPVPPGPWSYRLLPPQPEVNNNSMLSHGYPPRPAMPNTLRENHFAAPQQNGADLLASLQHPGRVLSLPQPTHTAPERSSLVAKRLADRLHPPGLWFVLQPADNKATHHQGATSKGLYMRIKDGKLPVSYLKRYLVSRLGLESEAEVEISCKGQPITSNLPLQHVRDSVWFSTMGTENADPLASNKPETSPGELLMVLTYHRLQLPQR